MTRMSPENISFDRLARLLEGIASLLGTAGRKEMERFDRLLQGFRPRWKKFQADCERTACRLNVFEAPNIRDKEIFHSRFLAYLLDPRERHDQGDKFLRGFLDRVLEEESPPADTAQAIVEREWPIGDGGQLDICIIPIENKVHAPEGDNQVARYHRWLASQCEREK